MRIIAGKAKGRNLKSIKNTSVRPTQGLVKEAIFSILTGVISKSTFLDLFSGFGNMGLEALSRGGEQATFVEKSQENVAIIKENIDLCGFADKSRVINDDVFNFLAHTFDKYGIIFMDPPYQKGLVEKVLVSLLDNEIIYDDSIIIAELYQKVEVELPEGLICRKQKLYGNTKVEFYQQEAVK